MNASRGVEPPDELAVAARILRPKSEEGNRVGTRVGKRRVQDEMRTIEVFTGFRVLENGEAHDSGARLAAWKRVVRRPPVARAERLLRRGCFVVDVEHPVIGCAEDAVLCPTRAGAAPCRR